MSVIDTSDTRPSVIVGNPKQEIGVMLAPAMREAGMTCLHINPTGQFNKITPNSNVNCWHHYYNAFHSDNISHQRSVVPMIRNSTKSMIPDPPRMDTEAAKFYLEGYRDNLEVFILYDIIDGRVPYPARIWEMLSNPELFTDRISSLAKRPIKNKTVRDKIEAYTISKARKIYSKVNTQGLQRYFEEFRDGAERYTSLFNTASHLASYGEKDSIPLTILREKPCFMTIDTPLAFMDEYGPFHEQFMRAIFEMAKLTPGRTLYILAEEAGTSLPKGIERELTTMRGLNIKMDFIFQYPHQFVLKAGEQGLQTLDSQIDVEIIAGVSQSDETTQHRISKRFGKTTEIISNQSSSSEGQGSISIDRRPKDVITPAQVAQTPREQQYVFVSNASGTGVKQPKTILTKVNYGQILPIRDLVSFNPIENKPPLYSDDIAIHLKYQRGEEPQFVNFPDWKQAETKNSWTVEDEPLLTPYSFLWLAVLIAIVLAVDAYTPFSLLPTWI